MSGGIREMPSRRPIEDSETRGLRQCGRQIIHREIAAIACRCGGNGTASLRSRAGRFAPRTPPCITDPLVGN
jgi:hypothetical protein